MKSRDEYKLHHSYEKLGNGRVREITPEQSAWEYRPWVYLMAGKDGWHKIGLSDRPEYRRYQLGHCPAGGRPVLIRKLQHSSAADIERIALHLMSMGRKTERHGEWFLASEARCAKAIRAAAKIVDEGKCEEFHKERRKRNKER